MSEASGTGGRCGVVRTRVELLARRCMEDGTAHAELSRSKVRGKGIRRCAVPLLGNGRWMRWAVYTTFKKGRGAGRGELLGLTASFAPIVGTPLEESRPRALKIFIDREIDHHGGPPRREVPVPSTTCELPCPLRPERSIFGWAVPDTKVRACTCANSREDPSTSSTIAQPTRANEQQPKPTSETLRMLGPRAPASQSSLRRAI